MQLAERLGKTYTELQATMSRDELLLWAAYDEMMDAARAIKSADPSLPDYAVLDMLRENQEKHGWVGRIT